LKSGASNQDGYFDIVIGNPPYVDSETMTLLGLEEERKYIVENYHFIEGNWDIYMAFFERGLTLSYNCLAYITPDKWLSKPFGKKFREKCMIPRLNKIVHAGSKVFDSATVDAIITLFIDSSSLMHAFVYDSSKQLNLMNSIQNNRIKAPYYIDSLFSKNNKLIEMIEYGKTNKISNYGECENACATSDAYNLKTFILEQSKEIKGEFFKLVNTGTIEKYHNKWGEKYITYLGLKILYPIVEKEIFNNSFGKAYTRKANSPKIIFKGLNLLDAFVDYTGSILPGKSTLVICSNNPQTLSLLCGILNSKLAFFYIKTKYSSSSYCGGITFSKDMINDFPIPHLNETEKTLLVDIVDKIIHYHKDSYLLKQKLDVILYKLYNLSFNEAKIIDPLIDITEDEYLIY
jgi:hypothetical protein